MIPLLLLLASDAAYSLSFCGKCKGNADCDGPMVCDKLPTVKADLEKDTPMANIRLDMSLAELEKSEAAGPPGLADFTAPEHYSEECSACYEENQKGFSALTAEQKNTFYMQEISGCCSGYIHSKAIDQSQFPKSIPAHQRPPKAENVDSVNLLDRHLWPGDYGTKSQAVVPYSPGLSSKQAAEIEKAAAIEKMAAAKYSATQTALQSQQQAQETPIEPYHVPGEGIEEGLSPSLLNAGVFHTQYDLGEQPKFPGNPGGQDKAVHAATQLAAIQSVTGTPEQKVEALIEKAKKKAVDAALQYAESKKNAKATALVEKLDKDETQAGDKGEALNGYLDADYLNKAQEEATEFNAGLDQLWDGVSDLEADNSDV